MFCGLLGVISDLGYHAASLVVMFTLSRGPVDKVDDFRAPLEGTLRKLHMFRGHVNHLSPLFAPAILLAAHRLDLGGTHVGLLWFL